MAWPVDHAKLDRVRALMKDQDVTRWSCVRLTTCCISRTTGA